MSALFNFQSLLSVVLLLICTCAYIRSIAPRVLDKNKTGVLGIFWKCARIDKMKFVHKLPIMELQIKFTIQWAWITVTYFTGERLSPYVALSCVGMAISILFFS